MEAERHRHRRSRIRNKTLAISWLGIAMSWGAVVYFEAFMNGDRVGGLLEGTLGLQILVTTVLFLSFGILKTRKQYRDPPIPGLLTRSRPGGRDAVFTAREDVGGWSLPEAHPQQNAADGDDAPDREPQSEEKARHLGIRRFGVPKTYRTTRVDDSQTSPAGRRSDPSVPPAA